MDLDHQFTVPVGVDEAWAHFQDIASVAECFPGAQVTGVEGDTFQGTVKVKLGPIALTYNGSGTFTEKDDDAHRFVVDAKGKDKRGNGTAGATVTLTMNGTGDATDVDVHTDLSITGKPAQFGRGVMQDVSDKLLGQFVSCLEQRLGESGGTASAAPAEAAEAPVATASAEAAEAAAVVDEPATTTQSAPAAESAAEPAAAAEPASAAEPATAATGVRHGSAEALDLGRTVLPVLAKTYWKQAVAGVVVAGVIIWIVRH